MLVGIRGLTVEFINLRAMGSINCQKTKSCKYEEKLIFKAENPVLTIF